MKNRSFLLAGLMTAALLTGCREGGLSDPFYEPEVTPTPTPVVTPTPSPNGGPTPTPIPSGGSGATMVLPSEEVTIVDFATDEFDLAVEIYVQRSNLEVWLLTVPQSPLLSISEVVVYQNASQIFGATGGSLLFPDNSQQTVTSSVRIQ